MPRRRKPPAPYVLAAEIGTVDELTIAVTFDQAVAASNYVTGVTVKVNGTPASIDTAERQENHAIVYYVLDDPVEAGDVVLWEYLDGLTAAEDDGVSLPGLVQPVTNNVSAAVAPEFQSAEIGTVNGYTLVVTFDSDIVASNYSTGVTVKVNNVSQTISSATRQANHAIVRYVIPIPWHGSGDALTWEYDADTGNIEGESGGEPLADVSAQVVTNNITWESLLDLQSDTGVTEAGGVVSAWADQSGNGRNFAQGTAGKRPALQTVGGYPAIVFDAVDDFLLGGNFADNLSSFAVIAVAKALGTTEGSGMLISKLDRNETGKGWRVAYAVSFTQFAIQEANQDNYKITFNDSGEVKNLMTYVRNSGDQDLHVFVDGSNAGETVQQSDVISDYSNALNVAIANYADGLDASNDIELYALGILSPAPGATDRAALETRLGARYGLTVP